MPTKEIKELRQEGKLEDALKMAKAEFDAQPENIWAKRNLAWVYYDYIKQNNLQEYFDSNIIWLNEIKNLQLPVDEKIMYEQLCWQIGKIIFGLLKNENTDLTKYFLLFEAVESFHFSKPSEAYSFLFKAFHRALKETDRYILFADWWDFNNFMPQDFLKSKLPNGKEVMSIAEQAYITYSKHLLPKQTQSGEMIFDKNKVIEFLPLLSNIVENYPHLQYPAYFNAKLLLAIGDKDNILDSLLPFVKKKRNDFWAWEILAEAFSNDPNRVFACYCKALSCNSPEEMLVGLRQKMAGLLITKKLYNEAKTEIELLINSRKEHGFKIPIEVINWQSQDWYNNATSQRSNLGFYKEYLPIAESLLFSDIPEETVFVDFVNTDKKILNFIMSETKFGFFKYDRFFTEIKIGETLRVRFQGGSNEGMHQIYTAKKVNDEAFKKRFIKKVSGIVKIPFGKPYGFLEDAFIHPTLLSRKQLSEGMYFEGIAIKSYNQEKKQWSWKLVFTN